MYQDKENQISVIMSGVTMCGTELSSLSAQTPKQVKSVVRLTPPNSWSENLDYLLLPAPSSLEVSLLSSS